MKRTKSVAPILIGALLLLNVAAGIARAVNHKAEQKCFSAQVWDADDSNRPCVRIDRLYEDASFSYSVTEADGTKLYSGGVGNPNE